MSAGRLLVFAFGLALGPTVANGQTADDLRAIWAAGDLARMEEIAAAGNSQAEAWMGLMLQNRHRYADALRWWNAAADKGNVWAMTNLGYMLRNGLGAPEDRAEAARWFRHAAELGSADAQLIYAETLVRGDGVAKDYQEAARWLSVAIGQRERYAYLPLAELYAAGQGVSRDPVEAHALASVAVVILDDSDFEPKRRAAQLKSSLGEGLTSEQMVAASRRANELR